MPVNGLFRIKTLTNDDNFKLLLNNQQCFFGENQDEGQREHR